MGRSPLFATFKEITVASLFKTISPAAANISPGTIFSLLSNRVMNADEFCVIRKRGLHLHFVDHLRDTFHDLVASQLLAAFRHEFGNRLAVARSFEYKIR